MNIDFETKIQNKYNYKFWIKLILGIIPLTSIVIFFAAQTADLFHDQKGFGDFIFKMNTNKPRTSEFSHDVLDACNGNAAQNIGYEIVRNAFMITTLGNIFASAFFLDSAVHNDKEGMGIKNGGGVLDTYRTGLAAINTLTFIVIAYNGSLVFSGAVGIMKGYNYVSGMCEHLLVPILMIVYFFVFYPKYPKSVVTYKNKTRNGFSFMGSSSAFVGVYMVFFSVLGYILRAANAFPAFGDMSSDGYGPYNFMDASNLNKTPKVMGMSYALEFVIAMVFIVAEQIITFAIYFASVNHQIKLQIKKQYGK